MKKYEIVSLVSVLTAFLMVAVCAVFFYSPERSAVGSRELKVGFVYSGDGSSPYTGNFISSEQALRTKYNDEIEILSVSNVQNEKAEEAVRELCGEGCNLIISAGSDFGEAVKGLAGEYPGVQFCQASCSNAETKPVYENYHTFMGEICEGRYVAGIAAGMKLSELIREGTIAENEAYLGFVTSFPIPESISGYTAYLLGARSVCPAAKLKVRYTDAWNSYTKEKEAALRLIESGCVIISQNTDTIAPAVACEEASEKRTVYHVGYHQSMMDVAPTTSIVSTRINWTPYILGAAEAVRRGVPIESYVKGNIHGHDIGAGFDRDWVRMVELNAYAAAPGTEEAMEEAQNALKRGELQIFRGDYKGVDPLDPSDTIDLRQGFKENENHSAPEFHYVLEDVVEVLK